MIEMRSRGVRGTDCTLRKVPGFVITLFVVVVATFPRRSESFVIHQQRPSLLAQGGKKEHSSRLGPLAVLNLPASFDINTTRERKREITNDDAEVVGRKEEITTLVPLSREPLIMESSRPLLSRDECQVLLKYLKMNQGGKVDPLNDVFFQREGEYVFSTAHESKVSRDSSILSAEVTADNFEAFCEDARAIIYRVRREIDRLTNSPSHPGDFALPRSLSFNVERIPDLSKDGIKETLHALLPDGLHSDNTNGMFTRHISALLYLSDEVDDERDELVGGATTFPLAVPLDNTTSSGKRTEWDENLINAAHRIVGANSLHTSKRDFETGDSDCMLLESAAYSLFHKEITNPEHSSKVNLPTSELGVRVNPMPGKLCVFHNLLDDGKPDPLAFHAGEAILGRSSTAASTGEKALLVFFKTVPNMHASEPNYDVLALKSAESRKWIRDQYY